MTLETSEAQPTAPIEKGQSDPPAGPPFVSRADEPAARPSRWRAFARFLWRRPGTVFLCVVGIGALGPALVYLILPAIRMHMAWTDSTACVGRFEQARGSALPNCASFIRDYERLADYDLTHHDATYRAEELWARIMMASYLNAAIGAPSSGDLARTSKYVGDAQGVLERGSQRISLDELGPAVISPNRGKFANAVGDRRALVANFESWSLWTTRNEAIRAALLDANLPLATTIASFYAEYDPREADLRTTIGAVLCLGPSPGTGVDFLERVPTDRYDKRYASIQRNYGEVLGVLKACSKRAGRPPPPLPQIGSAGVADVKETRLVEAARLAKDADSLGDALDRIVLALENEDGVEDRESRWARAYLLAALVARDAEAPAKPAPPRPTTKAPSPPEPAHPTPHTPPKPAPAATSSGGPASSSAPDEPERVGDDGLEPDLEGDDEPADEPPTLRLLADGTDRAPITNRVEPKLLASLARRREKESTLAPLPSHVLAEILDERPTLVPILPPEMLAFASERLEKIAAEITDADPAAEAARPELRAAAGALALHAGIVAARFGSPGIVSVQMDRAARLLELDDGTRRLLLGAALYVAGSRELALAELSDTNGGNPAVEMESALLRARLLAPDDSVAALEQVKRARALEPRVNDPALSLDARWMELALAPRADASGPLLLPVYTGQADVDDRWLERWSQPAVDANLRAWARALGGSSEEQLAFRYKLWRQGGDAPRDLGMYAVAGGKLLRGPSSEPDSDATEVWLDAMTAFDRERTSLFAYAFARAEAASIRRDPEGLTKWTDRLAGIRAVKASPELLEIARFLNY